MQAAVSNNCEFLAEYPSVLIPEDTLIDFVSQDWSKFADSDALIDSKTGTKLSYSQLSELLPKVSIGLARLGVEFNSVVGMWLPNCIEFFLAFGGATRMGAIISPANPLYTPDELCFQLSTVGARLTITTVAALPKLREALTLMARKSSVSPFEHHIVVVGADDISDDIRTVLNTPADVDASSERITISTFASLHAGVDSSQDAEDAAIARVEASVHRLREVGARNAVCCLPFSSGTTGLPKGVQLSHHNLVANICQIVERGTDLSGRPNGHSDMIQMGTEDSILGLLPFFHIFGLTVVLLTGLSRGSRVVIIAKFEPEPFLNLLVNYGVTVAHIVPPVLVFLAKHPSVEPYVPRLRLREMLSGAAPLGADLVAAVKTRLNLPCMRQGYGMTELSPVVLVEPFGRERPGSAGVLIPNVSCKIVSDWGCGPAYELNQRGPDCRGELCFRGPNVMMGYFKNEQATKDMIDEDGWLHTGDVGYIDEDGYIYVVDRIKELIKVKGFQVAPAELESLLLSHAGVADAAVVGFSRSPAEEEQVIAHVVLRNPDVKVEDIMAHVNSHVAVYKQIKQVRVIPAVPKSASGKILRRVLKDALRAEFVAQAELQQ